MVTLLICVVLYLIKCNINKTMWMIYDIEMTDFFGNLIQYQNLQLLIHNSHFDSALTVWWALPIQ